MNFTLLAPLGLAALVALALPIVIHLIRRIELRTTEFAALRWISERIRPRRRLRFERPWLLLLRLALLALIALLLARPMLREPSIVKPASVVVAPGAGLAAARAAVSLDNADWHWLAPGFPPIDAPAPSDAAPIASLLREIDADLPGDATLAVVVPENVAGLDGERPILSREVEWHVVPGSMSANSAAPSPAAVELAVRFAPSAEPMLKYLRAAVSTLNAQGSARFTLDAQPLDSALGNATRELVWLGADVSPSIADWIKAGGTAIVDAEPRATGTPVWRDADGNVLARAESLGAGRRVTLSATFSPETMPALLDADFPQHLLALLQGPAPAPTRAPASALKPAAHATASTSAPRTATKPLDPWLAMLIAALFLIERVVATRVRAPA